MVPVTILYNIVLIVTNNRIFRFVGLKQRVVYNPTGSPLSVCRAVVERSCQVNMQSPEMLAPAWTPPAEFSCMLRWCRSSTRSSMTKRGRSCKRPPQWMTCMTCWLSMNRRWSQLTRCATRCIFPAINKVPSGVDFSTSATALFGLCKKCACCTTLSESHLNAQASQLVDTAPVQFELSQHACRSSMMT